MSTKNLRGNGFRKRVGKVVIDKLGEEDEQDGGNGVRNFTVAA